MLKDSKRTNRYLILLILLLLLPLAGCLYFNQAYGPGWFLRAGLAASALILVLALLCVAIGNRPLRLGTGILCFQLLGLFLVARLLSFYFQGESFNDRFFFHASLNSLGEAVRTFPALLLFSAAFFLALALLSGLALYQTRPRPSRGHPLALLLLGIVGLALEPDAELLVRSSIASGAEGEIRLDYDAAGELGLHLEALQAESDEVIPGKNLLLIYLESLEKIYTEEDIFPGLTPYLNQLKTEGLYFSDLQQTRGTSWTVAGMMSTQCGTPLLTPFGPTGNDLLQNGYLNKVTCIGDLLDSAGYRQSYIGGASIRFAGKGKFYKLHGFDRVQGLDELQPRLDDPSYINHWGLYDDSMFDFAAREFETLSRDTDTPFNLTLLTVDTHHPAGTPSSSCPEYPGVDNRILHSVHCTDFLLRRFLEKLQRNPAWEDTVVVITSDHLAMRNIAWDLYPEDYEREIYTVVLNAGEPRQIDVKASHMDLAPTILDLLDVRHRHTFLAGDNLLDPGVFARDVSFGNGKRISTIKYINANHFTRLNSNLCSGDPLFSVRNDTLYRADQPMYLGKGGRAIPIETLHEDQSSITFFDDDGTVNSTVTINSTNLPYMIFQGRDYNFLALTSGRVAAQLLPDAGIGNGVAAIAGNVYGSTRVLANPEDIHDLLVEQDCAGLIAGIDAGPAGSEADELAFLASICPADGPEYIHFNPERGEIRFDKIAVENSWYSAVLKQQRDDSYQLVEQNFLGFMEPESNPDYCHAYFWRNQVLISRMGSPKGPVSMMLQRSGSDADDLFRVTGSQM